jgi:hypothetical protein
MTYFSNTARHLLVVSFLTSLKSSLYTALSIQNTTENNCIISHAQNTTTLQPNVFLNWNEWVAGHNQGAVAFLKRKPLPRSPANSTVNICSFCCVTGNGGLRRLSANNTGTIPRNTFTALQLYFSHAVPRYITQQRQECLQKVPIERYLSTRRHTGGEVRLHRFLKSTTDVGDGLVRLPR